MTRASSAPVTLVAGVAIAVGDAGDRPVAEVPGVPTAQAVAVTDGEGRGTVFVVAEEPGGGWAPRLSSLLDDWGATAP